MVLHQSAPWLNQVMVLLLKEKPLVQHVSGCCAIYNLSKILPFLSGCLEKQKHLVQIVAVFPQLNVR